MACAWKRCPAEDLGHTCRHASQDSDDLLDTSKVPHISHVGSAACKTEQGRDFTRAFQELDCKLHSLQGTRAQTLVTLSLTATLGAKQSLTLLLIQHVTWPGRARSRPPLECSTELSASLSPHNLGFHDGGALKWSIADVE